MKWINYFSLAQIPFNIYKLDKDDAILYTYTKKELKSIIILHGLVYITQKFTNNETSCIAILQTNNIFDPCYLSRNNANTYYYKIIALQKTFLISFELETLTRQHNNLNKDLLLEIIKAYKNTISKYYNMNTIFIHKYMKSRVIQLILLLSEEFGVIYKYYIMIPFTISQQTISHIIGSNRITVNRILRELCDNNLISYSQHKYIKINNPLALSHFILNKK